MNITIRKCENTDIKTAVKLAMRLWKGHSEIEMMNELAGIINSGNSAVYIAYNAELPVGYAQCSLRTDYVEGTSTSPVGYLEGVFTDEDYRGSGIASELLRQCEDWAREKGCSEFASDCEIDNDMSKEFHMKIGFEEVNIIRCFTKKLY